MRSVYRHFTVFITGIFFSGIIYAQDALLRDSAWNFHFQFTGIIQYNPPFQAPYSGNNSFLSKAERAYSVTTTAFFGRKLWPGGSFYFNPEMAGGQGLSS